VTIPTKTVCEFNTLFEKLQSESLKVNVLVPVYTIVNEEFRLSDDTASNVSNYEKFSVIEISGHNLNWNGCKMVGVIKFGNTQGETIIVPMPGEEIPKDYDIKKQIGKYSVLLQNVDTLEFIQVDSANMNDSPEHSNFANIQLYLKSVVKFYNMVKTFENTGFNVSDYYFETRDVLAYTTMVINKCGWISNKMSKTDSKAGISTSNMVVNYLTSVCDTDDRPSETEYKFADHVISWLGVRANAIANDTENSYNEYEIELFKTSVNKYIDVGKELALLCSGINYYNNEYSKYMSAHKGFLSSEIGSKVKLDITIVSKNGYSTMYGKSLSVLAEDENHKYVKFSTSANTKIYNAVQSVEIGATVKVNGTIKNKENYKENDYTVLTRVNIV